MINRLLTAGFIALVSGLLASSLSSLLARYALLGGASEFARGVLDGLSVVAYGAAIYLLVRSARRRAG